MYNYIGHHVGTPNNIKTKDTIILDYSSLTLLHCVLDRMDVDEGDLQVTDVDVMLEYCPVTVILNLLVYSTVYSTVSSNIILG